MKESVVFHSRYGDPRTIRVINDNEAELNIFNTHYIRSSQHPDTNKQTMVDPDGGPYISVGMSLKDLDRKLPDLEITSIDYNRKKDFYILGLI